MTAPIATTKAAPESSVAFQLPNLSRSLRPSHSAPARRATEQRP